MPMHISLPALLGAFLAAAVAPATAAPEKCVNWICLKSFVWCDDTGCAYPDGAYPRQRGASESSTYANLMSDRTYSLTWEPTGDKYTQDQSPTRVQWFVNDAPRWETTVPAGQYTLSFSPSSVFSDFPTALSPEINSTEMAAWAAYDYESHFRVDQPGVVADDDADPDDPYRHPFAVSGMFDVQRAFTEPVYELQAEAGSEDMYDKWELGVGIGVGVGVPVLMAAAAAAGWVAGKKKGAAKGLDAGDVPGKE